MKVDLRLEDGLRRRLALSVEHFGEVAAEQHSSREAIVTTCRIDQRSGALVVAPIGETLVVGPAGFEPATKEL